MFYVSALSLINDEHFRPIFRIGYFLSIVFFWFVLELLVVISSCNKTTDHLWRFMFNSRLITILVNQ